jgi:hypothetical protein
MTQRNKLIVGAVVVLGAYYLYDRNKKMKALAEVKAGAEAVAQARKESGRLQEANATLRANAVMGTTKAKEMGENLSDFEMKPAPEKVFFQGDLKI